MTAPKPTIGDLVKDIPVGVPTTITVGGMTLRVTRWTDFNQKEQDR